MRHIFKALDREENKNKSTNPKVKVLNLIIFKCKYLCNIYYHEKC